VASREVRQVRRGPRRPTGVFDEVLHPSVPAVRPSGRAALMAMGKLDIAALQHAFDPTDH